MHNKIQEQWWCYWWWWYFWSLLLQWTAPRPPPPPTCIFFPSIDLGAYQLCWCNFSPYQDHLHHADHHYDHNWRAAACPNSRSLLVCLPPGNRCTVYTSLMMIMVIFIILITIVKMMMMMMMVTHQITTSHIPTRWESVIMMKGDHEVVRRFPSSRQFRRCCTILKRTKRSLTGPNLGL